MIVYNKNTHGCIRFRRNRIIHRLYSPSYVSIEWIGISQDMFVKVGGISSPLPVWSGSGLPSPVTNQRWALIHQQTITGPAHVEQVGGFMLMRFNGLANMVNMPLGQFLRLTRLGLVALRFSHQSAIIHNLRRVARQNEQVIKGSRRQADDALANR